METYTPRKRYGDKLILPRINNRYQDIEYERLKLIDNTLDFVKNRVKRSYEKYNPYNNYQMYPPNLGNFYNQYPQSLGYHRPIRYFYQRPVQLDANTAFPEQQEYIQETIKHNKIVESMNAKAQKWGKPMRMDDLIKPADEVHYPIAKLISPAEFKKKQDEMEELRYQMEKVDPERRRQIREGNKKWWNKIRKLRFMIRFYRVMRQFTTSSISLRQNKSLISQANKADFSELTKFIHMRIKSIEDYAIDNFTKPFIIDKTLQVKTEDSVFIIKNFIHQIFHELSTNMALKEDIPDYVKKIMQNYTTDGKYLPDNFLTSFEFNRLEFDLGLKLTKMRTDRQAMMVCFIILYRVLILEIFNSYPKYFKRLAKLKAKVEPTTNDQTGGNKKKVRTSKKDNIKENVKYNMNFIALVLHFILKDAFLKTPKLYRENYKDTHLFKRFVLDGDTYKSIKSIEQKLKLDEIEFADRIPQLPKVAEFIKENFRWIQMYKMSAYSFCIQFVDNISI